MLFNDYGNTYRGTDASLIHDIQKAINGEYSAIACYEKLGRIASSPEERKTILEIRQDEINHYQVFSEIYTSLTGRTAAPRITEECPEEYCAGFKAAFKDEQETVDFYLEITDKADEPFIKEAFQRAAADEQNHAVWFSFFYFNNCPKM